MYMEVHKNENTLAAFHLSIDRDEFQFGENGLPTKRQMDVWQRTLRQEGVPAVVYANFESKRGASCLGAHDRFTRQGPLYDKNVYILAH